MILSAGQVHEATQASILIEGFGHLSHCWITTMTPSTISGRLKSMR
jgi:hypothetical protein